MTQATPRRLRILIVEDDLNICQTLNDLLLLLHHDVTAAVDGENGLAHLQQEHFDLLITDLGLPGISGWDVARASKRYQSGMPILAISSWQGNQAEQKLKECGINMIIWKPFRFHQIQNAIEDLCLSQPPKIPS